MEINTDIKNISDNKNYVFKHCNLNWQISEEEDFTKFLQELYSKKQFKQMEEISLKFKKKFLQSPNPYYFLGLSYYEQNRFEEAISVFKKALSKQVNENILNNLGLVYLKTNNLYEAINLLGNAFKINPKSAPIAINFCSALDQTGQTIKSYEIIKKFLNHNEKNILALEKLQQANEATKDDLLFCLKNLESLLTDNPKNIKILENLVGVLLKLKEYQHALTYSVKLLELENMKSLRYYNIAYILQKVGRIKDAKGYLISAIKLDQSVSPYWHLLGILEKKLGKIYHSIECYKKSLTLMPSKSDKVWGYNNIGNSYIKIGETKLAYEFYNEAIVNSNENKNIQNQVIQNYLCNLGYMSDDIKEIYNAHRKFRKKFDNCSLKFDKKQKYKTNDKIRIGYVSPDFRQHSVMFFFQQIMKNHNRDKFELFLYSNLEGIADNFTENFKKLSCFWRETTEISDDALIDKIKSDNINILVDLAGNFSGGRSEVFAQKAAPIQISYCGYVTTTGLKNMDYRFTTHNADPILENDKYYTEKLVRLPETFLCYSNNDIYSVQNPPKKLSNITTFASFNNISKINDKTISAWSALLKSLENSILLLKSSVASDDTVSKKLVEKFQKYGVQPNRIKYMKKTATIEDHLKIYNMVDVALDTFPFNGATTTFEALWMGVPVITMEGTIHHSRVATSILKSLNMDFCIAKDEKDFVRKGVKLSNDLTKLTILRKDLRNNLKNSLLGDGKAFTKNIETEYEKMFSKVSKKNHP